MLIKNKLLLEKPSLMSKQCVAMQVLSVVLYFYNYNIVNILRHNITM